METNKTKSKKTEQAAEAGSLRDLFITGLKDIYYAENALLKALPEMYEKATDVKLKTAIKDHILQTEMQVVRLEKSFELLGMKAEAKKCQAIEGIIAEMAAYGTLAAHAKVLNEREVLDLLLRTLGEEKKSDCLLTTIADTELNSQAAGGMHQSKDFKAV